MGSSKPVILKTEFGGSTIPASYNCNNWCLLLQLIYLPKNLPSQKEGKEKKEIKRKRKAQFNILSAVKPCLLKLLFWFVPHDYP